MAPGSPEAGGRTAGHPPPRWSEGVRYLTQGAHTCPSTAAPPGGVMGRSVPGHLPIATGQKAAPAAGPEQVCQSPRSATGRRPRIRRPRTSGLAVPHPRTPAVGTLRLYDPPPAPTARAEPGGLSHPGPVPYGPSGYSPPLRTDPRPLAPGAPGPSPTPDRPPPRTLLTAQASDKPPDTDPPESPRPPSPPGGRRRSTCAGRPRPHGRGRRRARGVPRRGRGGRRPPR